MTTAAQPSGFVWSPEMGAPKIGHRVWFRANSEGSIFQLRRVIGTNPYRLELVGDGGGGGNKSGSGSSGQGQSGQDDEANQGSSSVQMGPKILTIEGAGAGAFDLNDVFPRQDRKTLVRGAMDGMIDFKSGGQLAAHLASKLFDRSCSGLIFHKVMNVCLRK